MALLKQNGEELKVALAITARARFDRVPLDGAVLTKSFKVYEFSCLTTSALCERRAV